MAIVEHPQPLALPPGAGGTQTTSPIGIFTRPKAVTGWRAWVTTVDHKKIGIMYGVAAFFFFLVGGIEALLIRTQLIQPDGKLLSADTYNQVFTMHGITMVFLVVMPMAAAFAQLPDPAADRRPRRRVPAAERAEPAGSSSSAASS